MLARCSRTDNRDRPKPKTAFIKSPNFRLSLSLSLILFLHRFLFRFFSRLRVNLLTKDAAPFRERNPRISKSLTSRLAPAVGASLAGFALGVYPGDQLRLTIAMYAITRAAEFGYNMLENEGWFRNKPRWWGSWMLMPLATGQLLHAFVFDRDCFPKVNLFHKQNLALNDTDESSPTATSFWTTPRITCNAALLPILSISLGQVKPQ